MPPLPVIILARPQLGWNIGAAARAMGNFGFSELRLVAPRGAHPSASALRMASGAEAVVESARLFPDVASALADLSVVLATSARRREMTKPELTPREAALRLREASAAGARCGLLFGPERAGLENAELILAESLVRVPTDPSFSSLNLAQCVLLMAYECFLAFSEEQENAPTQEGEETPATRAELLGFFEQLESALEGSRFFHPESMRPATEQKLRNFFVSARPSARQLRMLRGVVKALTSHRRNA